MNRFLHLDRRQLRVVVVLLAVAILLVAVAPSTQAAPEEQGVYHTVRPGEYLSMIARYYGVSVHAILQANPFITNPNLIYPGMVLYIPVGHYPPPPQPPPQPPPPQPPPPTYCRYYHTVAWGQTLSQIGRIYGVNIYRIAEANRILNLNLIFAGQVLCIP